MNIRTYFLPPDVFLRHQLVVGVVQQQATILDVGGSLGELKKFLPFATITTADVVSGADVIYDGEKLPLSSNSCDVVVSVDTVEHISPLKRKAFVRELLRVASKKVVIIAPYASVAHESYEQHLLNQFAKQRKQIPRYLREHRVHGLISESLLGWVRQTYTHATISLIGSVTVDRLNFSIHLFEHGQGKLNKILYYLKFLWNVVINILWWFFARMATPHTASRVLVVIPK